MLQEVLLLLAERMMVRRCESLLQLQPDPGGFCRSHIPDMSTDFSPFNVGDVEFWKWLLKRRPELIGNALAVYHGVKGVLFEKDRGIMR